MIQNYSDLTRLEMEQVNKDETIVLIPLGALEQHGNQAPLGTDDIIAISPSSSADMVTAARKPGSAGYGRYHRRGHDRLYTQGVGSGRFRFSHADISGHPRRLEHGAQEFLRLHHI